MELNHLSSGYEPDEIPFLYSAFANWGTRIRTWTNGVKVRCPTIRRFPNNSLTIDTIHFFPLFSRENKEKYQKRQKSDFNYYFYSHFQTKTPQKNITLHFCLAKISLRAFLFHKKISILESNMLNCFALSKEIPSISDADFKFLDSKISHIWGINPISKNPLRLTDSIPPSKILSRI